MYHSPGSHVTVCWSRSHTYLTCLLTGSPSSWHCLQWYSGSHSCNSSPSRTHSSGNELRHLCALSHIFNNSLVYLKSTFQVNVHIVFHLKGGKEGCIDLFARMSFPPPALENCEHYVKCGNKTNNASPNFLTINFCPLLTINELLYW